MSKIPQKPNIKLFSRKSTVEGHFESSVIRSNEVLRTVSASGLRICDLETSRNHLTILRYGTLDVNVETDLKVVFYVVLRDKLC